MLMLFSALVTSGGTEEPIYPRQKSSATKSTAIHIVTEANIKNRELKVKKEKAHLAGTIFSVLVN